MSALIWACDSVEVEIVRLLINNNANVNIQNNVRDNNICQVFYFFRMEILPCFLLVPVILKMFDY